MRVLGYKVRCPQDTVPPPVRGDTVNKVTVQTVCAAVSSVLTPPVSLSPHDGNSQCIVTRKSRNTLDTDTRRARTTFTLHPAALGSRQPLLALSRCELITGSHESRLRALERGLDIHVYIMCTLTYNRQCCAGAGWLVADACSELRGSRP